MSKNMFTACFIKMFLNLRLGLKRFSQEFNISIKFSNQKFKSGARVKIGYVAKPTSDGIKVKDWGIPVGIPKRNIRYFSDSSSGSSGKYTY